MVVAVVLCACRSAAPAWADSLPTVPSGALPGPPVLYDGAPRAPQLENRAPFAAAPLLVSGTTAYRDGEFLYQDYLFDDRGADTVPVVGTRDALGSNLFSAGAGDVRYPLARRFAGNAADLVELRIRPEADAIAYRVTLNAALDPRTSVVGIGIDTDRSGGGAVDWPLGAGVSSPGLDRFVTAWGTGGATHALPGEAARALPGGAVTMDLERNQMTIRVPRAVMDPGSTTWRYVAGTGLWDDAAGRWLQVAPGGSPGDATPSSGSALAAAPAVFNLAFRHDEPQTKAPDLAHSTAPGIGNWFEDGQARLLRQGTTGDLHADVDFAALAARADRTLRKPGGDEQARMYPSSLGLPEGVRTGDVFPKYGGQLQPYLLTVPPSYRAGTPVGLTFALHSLGGTYTQYAVFSPNQLRQFGPERDSLVLTTLGHGPDGWYDDEAESDVFQAWADVARHFMLDPERVAIGGYSMGGRGTYKLVTRYPDLFGRAFTAVGPPGRGTWIPPLPPSDGAETNSNPLLESARWVPFMNWVGLADELVPIVGPRAQQNRFDALGLRSTLWTFPVAEHLALGFLDQWSAARDFLGEARVKRDPWRVDHAFLPAADSERLGLVADHAYWLSGLRARDPGRDRPQAAVRALAVARSLAFGERDAPVARTARADAGGGPGPATVDGTTWGAPREARAENALELDLRNVERAVVDGPRARLSPARELHVQAKGDGDGSARVELPLRYGARVLRGEASVDRDGATVPLGAGTRQVLIAAGCPDRARPRSRLERRTGRTRSGRSTLRGRASDRGCGPRGRGGILTGVRVAIAKRVGRACRHLGSDGRLGARRSCRRPRYLDARRRGGRFTFSSARRLPAGRYVALSRAADREGNAERRGPRNRVTFRVR